MKKAIAVITARGGSKRIPKKNIRIFINKPIIAYSISAALRSKLFDEVMVSTDDKEIAQKALEYGAKIPFFRSKKNSDDKATSAEVVLEVLQSYEKLGERFEYVCCIYPTAPFITAEVLQATHSTLVGLHVDAVIPVVKFSYPIQRSLKMSSNNYVSLMYPSYINTRSQNLESAYHDAGQFYWLRVASFLKQRKLFMNKTIGYRISELLVRDIDTQEDWNIAEEKYRALMMRSASA